MEMLLNLAAYVGVAFLLMAYYLLVIGQMHGTDTHHIMLNMLGALFIIIAVRAGGDVPYCAGMVIWLFISLYGLYKHSIAVADEAL